MNRRKGNARSARSAPWLAAAAALLWAAPAWAELPRPVAHWQFEETEGNTAFDAAGGHNGEISGTVARVEGVAGRALRFTAHVNGYVRVPSAPELAPATAMTVSAWVRPAAPSGPQAIVSKWHDANGQWSYILKEQGSSYRIELSKQTHHDLANLFAGSVVFDRWVHVAATFDGQTARLYTDGILRGEQPTNGSAISQCTTDLLIGAVNVNASGAAAEMFNGDIDEVRIFDRALSAEELALLGDVTAPVTTATVAPPGWTPGSVAVDLSATDDLSGVREIRYRLGAGPEAIIAGSQGTVVVDQEGVTALTYYAVDAAGNAEALRTVTAYVDRTPPVTAAALAGVAGTNGWFRSAVDVAMAATDALSGVREIRFQLDAGAEVAVPGEAAVLTVTGNGVHQVAYRAVDVAGNAEPPQALTVSIDQTAPVALMVVFPTSLLPNGRPQNVFVLGGAADLTSGVASVRIVVTDSAGAVVATRAGFNGPVSLVGTRGEVYTVAAVVTDRAGNETALTRQVRVP